jgi:hypothetical protein
MPEQELDGPEIARASIDQCSFCASQRMGPKQLRVQPNTSDPLRYEARILTGGHAGVRTAPTREQELPGPFVGRLKIIIDGLAGLFAQFESDGPSGLLLSDGCAIHRVATGSDIFDPDGDDITATKFAVDSQIKHGEVASAAFDLELRPDRPDVLRSQRGFAPVSLPLFQGNRL